MTDRYALRASRARGSSVPHVDPAGHVCGVAGLSVIALPPGKVDLRLESTLFVLNVAPDGSPPVDEFRVNGQRPEQLSRGFVPGHVAVHAAGQEVRLRCINASWELLVELDEARLVEVAAERLDGRLGVTPGYAGGRDLASGTLGRLLIEHLRFADRDPLYVESLAVAIASRQLATLANVRRDVSTAGTDDRVRRVVDYIETFLERSLTLEELAGVAGMSPSWLTRSFRRVTGLPVHAFVRERRLERARTMIGSGDEALSTVASACGFWDQAHLTRTFKRRYGVTPAAWRRERGR